MDKFIDVIVDGILSNFDFGFMFIVNVLTYIVIKVIDYFNGDNKVPTWQKRCILIISIFTMAIIYIASGYDNTIMLVNSAILAPVFWSWVVSPILKKLGVGYKDIDNILELGNEGRLISMQLNELIRYIERDGILLIRDYCGENADYNSIYKDIQRLNSEELVDLEIIAKVLGFGGVSLVDTLISPKGYRILFKIPRIPTNVIENLIKHFKELRYVITASSEELDKVEGIGEARATAIRTGLKRIKEQINLKKEI